MSDGRRPHPGPGRRRWRLGLGLALAILGVLLLAALTIDPVRNSLASLLGAGPAGDRRPAAPARQGHDARAPGVPVAAPPGVDPEATSTRFEDFSSDPGWAAERNRSQPPSCPPVRQNLGYRPTARAGGATGEVGGRVFRTHQRAYYAKPLDRPLTLEDRFSVEGTLNVERLSREGSSGILFGLFNHAAQDWRTPQSLVLRVFDSREQPGKMSIAAEYGTRRYRTDQLAVARGGGVEDPEGRAVVAFDLRRPRRFKLDYDPVGAGGRGRVVLSVEGAPDPVVLDLLPGHRRDGAVFDRFGMLNQQHEVSGWIDAYFGDLRLDGRPMPVAAEPAWEGRGNGRAFRDCEVETFHNFGFGGPSAVAGGLVWRTDPESDLAAWYADGEDIELDLDQELYASGRIRLDWANSDSGVYVGWFGGDSEADGAEGGSKHVPTHLLAMLVEGPSEVGWYARPAYGTEEPETFGMVEGGAGTPTIHPGPWQEFTLHYDPEAGEHGEIAVTLGGRESRLPVTEEARDAGAELDHFGIRNVEDDGHAMMPLLDDLTYTQEERD